MRCVPCVDVACAGDAATSSTSGWVGQVVDKDEEEEAERMQLVNDVLDLIISRYPNRLSLLVMTFASLLLYSVFVCVLHLNDSFILHVYNVIEC